MSRVLDKRARTYAVHLEVSQDDLVSTSDYNIELRPDEPKKPKKGEPPAEDKPKPGSYLLRLTDLRWKGGTLSRHSDLFGSGIVSFEDQGFPSAFLSTNWFLSPFLGFYAPGGGVASLSDLPISDAPVGVGWTLTGKARLESPVASGQPMTLTGTLKGPGAAELQVSATSIFDSKTGWPKSCSGTLQGASLTVTWSCKLH